MSDDEDNSPPAFCNDIDDPEQHDQDPFQSSYTKKSTQQGNTMTKSQLLTPQDELKNETMKQFVAKYAMDNERHKLMMRENVHRLKKFDKKDQEIEKRQWEEDHDALRKRKQEQREYYNKYLKETSRLLQEKMGKKEGIFTTEVDPGLFDRMAAGRGSKLDQGMNSGLQRKLIPRQPEIEKKNKSSPPQRRNNANYLSQPTVAIGNSHSPATQATPFRNQGLAEDPYEQINYMESPDFGGMPDEHIFDENMGYGYYKDLPNNNNMQNSHRGSADFTPQRGGLAGSNYKLSNTLDPPRSDVMSKANKSTVSLSPKNRSEFKHQLDYNRHLKEQYRSRERDDFYNDIDEMERRLGKSRDSSEDEGGKQYFQWAESIQQDDFYNNLGKDTGVGGQVPKKINVKQSVPNLRESSDSFSEQPGYNGMALNMKSAQQYPQDLKPLSKYQMVKVDTDQSDDEREGKTKKSPKKENPTQQYEDYKRSNFNLYQPSQNDHIREMAYKQSMKEVMAMNGNDRSGKISQPLFSEIGEQQYGTGNMMDYETPIRYQDDGRGHPEDSAGENQRLIAEHKEQLQTQKLESKQAELNQKLKQIPQPKKPQQQQQQQKQSPPISPIKQPAPSVEIPYQKKLLVTTNIQAPSQSASTVKKSYNNFSTPTTNTNARVTGLTNLSSQPKSSNGKGIFSNGTTTMTQKKSMPASNPSASGGVTPTRRGAKAVNTGLQIVHGGNYNYNNQQQETNDYSQINRQELELQRQLAVFNQNSKPHIKEVESRNNINARYKTTHEMEHQYIDPNPSITQNKEDNVVGSLTKLDDYLEAKYKNMRNKTPPYPDTFIDQNGRGNFDPNYPGNPSQRAYPPQPNQSTKFNKSNNAHQRMTNNIQPYQVYNQEMQSSRNIHQPYTRVNPAHFEQQQRNPYPHYIAHQPPNNGETYGKIKPDISKHSTAAQKVSPPSGSFRPQQNIYQSVQQYRSNNNEVSQHIQPIQVRSFNPESLGSLANQPPLVNHTQGHAMTHMQPHDLDNVSSNRMPQQPEYTHKDIYASFNGPNLASGSWQPRVADSSKLQPGLRGLAEKNGQRNLAKPGISSSNYNSTANYQSTALPEDLPSGSYKHKHYPHNSAYSSQTNGIGGSKQKPSFDLNLSNQSLNESSNLFRADSYAAKRKLKQQLKQKTDSSFFDPKKKRHESHAGMSQRDLGPFLNDQELSMNGTYDRMEQYGEGMKISQSAHLKNLLIDENEELDYGNN